MRLAIGTAALVAAALTTFAILSANEERLEFDGQFAERQGRPKPRRPTRRFPLPQGRYRWLGIRRRQ